MAEGGEGLPGDGKVDVYRLALEHAGIGMALVSPNGRFLQVNQALCDLLDRDERSLSAATWMDLTHPDDVQGDQQLVDEVIAGLRDGYRLSKRYLRPDGSVIHGDLSVAAIRDADGSVRFFVSQVLDETEQVELRDRYRLLAENASDVIAMGDNDGVIRWISPSVTSFAGWQPAELVGTPFAELIAPEDRPGIAHVQHDVLAGRIAEVEVRMLTRDGALRWSAIRVKPVLDEYGQIVGRVGSWWDVSEEREARIALAASEERLRAALDAELDAHVFLTAVRDEAGAVVDFTYTHANAGACAYLRRSAEDLLGRSLLTLFPGQRTSGLFDRYRAVIETGEPLIIDAMSVNSEVAGSVRNFDFRGVRFQDSVSLTWRDVTDRIRAEQELAESQRQYRLLAENASDVVFQLDLDMNRIWVSESVAQVLDLSREQFLSPRARHLVPDDELADVDVALAQAAAGESVSFRTHMRSAQGTHRWMEVWIRTVRDALGDPVARVGGVRDVHEQVLAERALAEAEERYRLAAENAADILIGVGPSGTIDWAFGSIEDLLGMSPADLIGRPAGPTLSALNAEPQDVDLEARRAAVERGEMLVGLVEVLRPDGRRHWFDRRTRSLRSSDGTMQGVVVSLRDAQAEVEYRRALEESERQARDLAERYEVARNEALEANLAKTAFLSRMSHELRTPLNSVLGFAQLLAMDPLTDEQQEAVESIRTGGRHLLDLISEILDISRIEAGRLSLSMESVWVHDAVQEALDLVRTQAEAAEVTIVPLAEDSCAASVWADRQRVIQILLNLLSNAVKYNRPGGRVEVTCNVIEGTWVAIHVADTGIGIPATSMSRLFEPFDRLGAESTRVEGTGIGLALSRGLAVAMGGRIDVESSMTEGSVFTVVLRSVGTGAHDSTMRPIPSIPIIGRATRVLYVEDNPANMNLMRRIIGLRDGAVLDLAPDGATGLQLAVVHPPDLVLLDLHLPDMPGEDVLRRLRASRLTAEVPVIIVTADASPDVRRRAIDLGAAGVIHKPVDIAEVLAWVDDPAGLRFRT